MKTGGQILIDALRVQGVDRAFCVPGESYLAVLDALYDAPSIALVTCRQEGGAAIMAEAHGKLTGRPGVCFVTRGPGATNASTGVHTAFQDSTPMVLFIGQVDRGFRDREGFQEVDLCAMFGPLAKWAAEIVDPRRIPEYVHRAFQTAMAGRPGPVVLALPEDMLAEVVDTPVDPGRPARPIPAAIGDQDRAALAEMLAASERPLVIVGGGGWSEAAGRALLTFAERQGVPVATSLRCQDYVDNAHPNYVGHFAVAADPALAQRLRDADLVIALGARLGEMTTGSYTLLTPPLPGKALVHVHADPEELGRVYQADLPINAAAAVVAEALAALPPALPPGRSDWVASARADFLASREPLPTEAPVDLGVFVRMLAERLPEDAIVCNGAGNYAGWLHRHWLFRRYRTQLAPTSGAMGYGVPAAIAASLTHPERRVVSMAGDGCFQMHCQELATATQFGAKVLFVIANNASYGTIRMHQERQYPRRIIATDLVNPDFVALAAAYGIPGERIERTADIAVAIDRALAAPGCALIELRTDVEYLAPSATIGAIRDKAAAAAMRAETASPI